MQAPTALFDYVIAHELAHLLHPDHTPAFWSTLGHARPDYEARREKLHRLGLVFTSPVAYETLLRCPDGLLAVGPHRLSARQLPQTGDSAHVHSTDRTNAATIERKISLMQPPIAVPSAPVRSLAKMHLPDLVRAVMLVVGVLVLVWLTVLNKHLELSPVAWVVFVAYVGLALTAAWRIVFMDALPPRDQASRVMRTGQRGMFTEFAIAGLGGIFLIVPVAYLMMTTSKEVWAGVPRESHYSTGQFIITLSFFAVGFFMVFWRPQFVLNVSLRKITRHAFAQSLSMRAQELPYADLTVSSEGYFITNRGVRLGDIIRGRVGKYTFDLQMLHGNLRAEDVQAHAMRWAAALMATYKTPEQAGSDELKQ